jgi:peptidoglycan endopeptidase LytE
MSVTKLFPCVVAACFCVTASVTTFAQKSEARARLANQIVAAAEVEEPAFSKDDEPVVVSEATPEDIKLARIPSANSSSSSSFNQLISLAIDERLGARYKWGATGPSSYDCSGFVWSIFQAAGINFERSSARTLWSRFEAPTEDEKFEFGTLVFFSNLAHVGVVADEHGFYHASRHHGVIYSTFSEYWLARLDGFRKVPTTSSPAQLAVTKAVE